MASSSESGEVYRPAFDSGYPHISYGLPFQTSCARHVAETFKASRVYIIASGSLSRNTDNVTQLQNALGSKVVGSARSRTCFGRMDVARLLSAKGLQDADLGELLTVFIAKLGMPRSLKKVGVGKEKLDLLAKNSLRDRWCGTNPRPLTEKWEVMEILEMVKG